MTTKPHIVKHKKGWKCFHPVMLWQQVVHDTPKQAYDRWRRLRQTFWRSNKEQE